MRYTTSEVHFKYANEETIDHLLFVYHLPKHEQPVKLTLPFDLLERLYNHFVASGEYINTQEEGTDIVEFTDFLADYGYHELISEIAKYKLE